MRKYLHPLDPDLTPEFLSDRVARDALPVADSRTLFYQLIHCSEYPAILPQAYAFIKQRLQATQAYSGAHFTSAYHPDLLHSKRAVSHDQACIGQMSTQDALVYLQQLSPLWRTEPAWLNTAIQAATTQTPFASKLVAVSLSLQALVSRSAELNAPLQVAGIELPALHTWAFAGQTGIQDAMFEFAALQLALGQFPRTFFPECLGFSVAYCQANGLIEQLFSDQPEAANLTPYLQYRQALLHAQRPVFDALIEAYLTLFPSQHASCWLRIQQGFWLFYQQTTQCLQQLNNRQEQPPSLQHALATLIERLRGNAIGHHGTILLGAKTIDTWFAETPFDATGFLAALKHSTYVDQDNPAASRLLTLFDFKGPMFGVLSTVELDLLRQWLSAEAPTEQRYSAPLAAHSAEQRCTLDGAQASFASKSSTFTNRLLYYALMSREGDPAPLRAAEQNVQKVLRIAGLTHGMPFKDYTHQRFDNYIDTLYQQEVKAYQPLVTAPRLSKKTLIWGMMQLAPTLLVDGCWLQAVGQLRYQPTHAIGALLFKIYGDEIGNGVLSQNHPFLYQQLLDSVGITLPPPHTQAFSQYPGFIERAFDIPCYLLAISKFPSTFLPELLGLNMAIELSGLGKDYLRLAQVLRFYHLDATFVAVHISIDNLATGHAAVAKQAIQMYLDGVLAVSGQRAVDQHWRRIYRGYCSLAAVSLGFKAALVSRVLAKKLTDYVSIAFNVNRVAPKRSS